MHEKFVYAVHKGSTTKRLIPAKWLDHPTLGAGWKLAPTSARARVNQQQRDVGDPDETGTEVQAFQDAPSTEENNHNESPATGEEE